MYDCFTLLAGILFDKVYTALWMFLFTFPHIFNDLLYKQGSTVSSRGVEFKAMNISIATKINKNNHLLV